MPPEPVNVDHYALKTSGDNTDIPAETIKKALASFYAKVAGLPVAPWGDDEIGRAFLKAYDGQKDPQPGGHKLLLKSLADLADGFIAYGDTIRSTSAQYSASEDSKSR